MYHINTGQILWMFAAMHIDLRYSGKYFQKS